MYSPERSPSPITPKLKISGKCDGGGSGAGFVKSNIRLYSDHLAPMRCSGITIVDEIRLVIYHTQLGGGRGGVLYPDGPRQLDRPEWY